jgi:putative spermidine/putrescine transport system permease protein
MQERRASLKGRSLRSRPARSHILAPRRLIARAGYATLAAPAVVLVGLLIGVPLVQIVSDSLRHGGSAYSEIFGSKTFWASLRATLELAAIVTVVCLVLGYPVAYLASRSRPRRAALLLLAVMLCFWISILVRTYAWTVLLGRRGLVNDTLMNLGFISEPLDLLYTRFSVVVGMTHYLLPFMILALFAGLKGIDHRLVDAARTLGASNGQAFRRVFLPLSGPAVFAGCTIVFILAIGFFITPALLGGPKDATIAVYIERQLFYLRFDLASAAAVVLLTVICLAFLIANRIVGIDRLFAAVRGQ